MRMTVLSHAGLCVESGGRQLICDPWLIGSCYWRSWWNYPPVSKQLIRSLHPDWIYLTHIHWDHFHGASLRLFPRETPILIPRDRYTRMRDDLKKLGLTNIIELSHGKRHALAENFALTSYHFSPLVTDSAVVIEAEGTTILNANDAKFMGLPLKQILSRHPKIDFALRSHSSANGRLTYRYTDAPNEVVDDVAAYSRAFCNFMYSVKPRYAVPFASNHCHLHRDTRPYNAIVTTPDRVAKDFDSFKKDHPLDTELKIMTSGDSWDSESGFQINPSAYLADRETMLAKLADSKQRVLERYYVMEARAKVPELIVKRFFDRFFRAVPSLLLRRYRGKFVVLESVAGEKHDYFLIDFSRRRVDQIQPDQVTASMMRMTVPASILRQALVQNMFAHAAISKRVSYQATKADMPLLEFFAGNLLAWYEYECLPLRNLFTWRTISSFARRWREVILYGQLAASLLAGSSLRKQEERLLVGARRRSAPLNSPAGLAQANDR